MGSAVRLIACDTTHNAGQTWKTSDSLTKLGTPASSPPFAMASARPAAPTVASEPLGMAPFAPRLYPSGIGEMRTSKVSAKEKPRMFEKICVRS